MKFGSDHDESLVVPPLTFLSKVVDPGICIAGLGMGTLLLWLDIWHGENGNPPPTEMKWLFLAMWIAAIALILWSSAGLKRVRMDSKNLYLSNYRREISVPLSMICNVTENRWISSHPVTIHFREKTQFLQKDRIHAHHASLRFLEFASCRRGAKATGGTGSRRQRLLMV